MALFEPSGALLRPRGTDPELAGHRLGRWRQFSGSEEVGHRRARTTQVSPSRLCDGPVAQQGPSVDRSLWSEDGVSSGEPFASLTVGALSHPSHWTAQLPGGRHGPTRNLSHLRV